jgi:hypothetical protein
MERRQLKKKRRRQRYTDHIKGVKSKSKSRRANGEDNISQTNRKTKEYLNQSKETS